jgi:hypothetical protein
MDKYTQYLVDDYDPLSVVDDSDEDWYNDDDDELATLVIAEMFDDTRNFKVVKTLVGKLIFDGLPFTISTAEASLPKKAWKR